MRCKWIHSTIMVLFLVATSSAWAADIKVAEQTPHQLVATVTDLLLGDIADHRDTFDDNPESFFEALDGLLADVVDFNWIALKVMGSYGKQATPDQRTRFASAFRCELIETYGRGLMAYSEQDIVVLPPVDGINGLRKVTVVQEIRGNDGVFPLTYSMGLNRDDQWKVTNVVINGINLGKTFRNQFLQRAQKFDGNIDQIIDDWSPES